jgi:two-component system, LytTR family, response regulator LytT
MSKIKIGVVEDEVIIADSICAVLRQLGYTTCEPSTSYSEALEMIETEKPDLLLLDIHLAGSKDGIQLAAEIKARFALPFIFLTANSDSATVERAKTVEPPAFLVKPFNKEELYTSIEICLSNFARSRQKVPPALPANSDFMVNNAIFIKDGYTFVKLLLEDIYYLQSDHVYVKVIARDKEFLVRSSLQQYAENFDGQKFFRIGKSHIINVDHIQKLDAASVTINGHVLPMAKQFRDELMKRLRLA